MFSSSLVSVKCFKHNYNYSKEHDRRRLLLATLYLESSIPLAVPHCTLFQYFAAPRLQLVSTLVKDLMDNIWTFPGAVHFPSHSMRIGHIL